MVAGRGVQLIFGKTSPRCSVQPRSNNNRSRQIGIRQVRPSQVSFRKIYPGQIGTRQIRFIEVDTAEIGPGQVGVGQCRKQHIGFREILPAEVPA